MNTFLNRRVLVLNQSYEPIMVIGAKRAIILVLNEKVDAIENDLEWTPKYDATQFEMWVLQKEGIDDHTSHTVAPEKCRDSLPELFYQCRHVEVKVRNYWSFSAGSC